MEQNQIFEKVRDCLVEVLDVEPDDVSSSSKLTEDLDAESIDFVDIIYRLEQTFKIKIPQGELFPQDLVSNKEYVEAGTLTDKGMSILRERYPFLQIGDEGAVKVADLPRFYTVDMLVKYLSSKVN